MKEKDKEVEKAAEVGHEQVEAALLQKFDLMKAEEAEVQGIILLCVLLDMQNDLLMVMKLYKIVCDSLVFSILAYLVCLSDSHVYYLSISMMHHNYASLG